MNENQNTSETTCINCNYEHQEKFCPNCGEKSIVSRITFNSILGSAFSSITNMDSGFLYNLKYLTISPKETITKYISGKRKGVYNPLSYLFITITLYLILDSVIPNTSLTYRGNDSPVYSLGYEFGKVLRLYLKYFWMIGILWLSIAARIFFKKYNFAELLVVSAFVIGHATIIAILGLLLLNWIIIFNPFVYLGITILLYQTFSTEKEKIETFFISATCTFLFFLQFLMMAILIALLLKWIK